MAPSPERGAADEIEVRNGRRVLPLGPDRSEGTKIAGSTRLIPRPLVRKVAPSTAFSAAQGAVPMSESQRGANPRGLGEDAHAENSGASGVEPDKSGIGRVPYSENR